MEGISQGLHCQNNLLISGLKLRVRDLNGFKSQRAYRQRANFTPDQKVSEYKIILKEYGY